MSSLNKREHFRVKMIVPVRWQALNEEETELVKKGYGSTLYRQDDLPSPIDDFLEQVAPGSEEEQLYRSLQYINNKLDYIIDQLLYTSVESSAGQDNVVDISASGLKFTSQEHIDTGTLIKVNMIMPGTFQYQMDFIAEVVRVEERDKGFIVAAKIVQIDEDSRESIVKVVFQKQRKDIRRKRIEEGDINAG